MDLVFNGYAFQHICKFLDPKDIINICHIYPHQWTKLYHIFKESIIRKIDNFFRDYFSDHYDEFRTEMIKNKAVVSGSFILQIILNETWENSDIDIYIPIKGVPITYTDAGKPKTSLEDFFYTTTLHLCPSFCPGYSVSPITQILYVRDYRQPDPEINNMHNFLTHRNYYDLNGKSNSKITFQTIILDVSPNYQLVKEHIHGNFDFDICKNIFYYDDNGSHLSVYKASHIIDKKTIFSFNSSTLDPLARYVKYKTRGFSFNNEGEIFKMIIDKSICQNRYNILINRFRIFKGTIIKMELIPDCFRNAFYGYYHFREPHFGHNIRYVIEENVSGDEFPYHYCKNNLLGTQVVDKTVQICLHTSPNECKNCPIKIFLGNDIEHFHFNMICQWCYSDEGPDVDYIFIYKKIQEA